MASEPILPDLRFEYPVDALEEMIETAD